MTVWQGRGIQMECRDATTDWNTVNAAVGEDEYKLADVSMDGKLVFDVGSHIGSVGIWCASRGAHAVCVEPIPENIKMIQDNAYFNSLETAVEIVVGAAGNEGLVEILYGYESNETERAHAFIGNIGGASGHSPGKVARVPGITLSHLVLNHGVPDIIKLDCEGGEWPWLKEELISKVPLIVGEWHPTDGHQLTDVVLALESSHKLEFTGPHAGPGGFRASH